MRAVATDVVCLSVCLSITAVSPAKTAEKWSTLISESVCTKVGIHRYRHFSENQTIRVEVAQSEQHVAFETSEPDLRRGGGRAGPKASHQQRASHQTLPIFSR